MKDFYVSWPEYHHTIERLAVQIYRSQWEFDRIVCLARGGLRVGDLLSRLFDRPLAILAAASYGGENGRMRCKIHFSDNLTTTAKDLSARVLLVDDLVDSGTSMRETISWLRQRYGEIEEIRTGVLWYKGISTFEPDYYVTYLPDSPWIRQPVEKYEMIAIAELAETIEAIEGRSPKKVFSYGLSGQIGNDRAPERRKD